jgi:hypothetical protein
MCVYHNSSEAVRIRSGSDGPGRAIIAGPSSSLSSPSSSTLIPGSCFTSVFIRVYDVRGCPSNHEGWVEDAKRGLLGGIGLNGGGIPPKRGLGVLRFVTLQYPLRLAFAMTINKGQGQSLNHVGLDFRTPIFSHGQFYVAISQATSVDSIKVIWDPKLPQPTTKNIVFQKINLFFST